MWLSSFNLWLLVMVGRRSLLWIEKVEDKVDFFEGSLFQIHRESLQDREGLCIFWLGDM